MDFTNRTVVVTGGSKGVGLGIAQVFLASGAEVVVCGRSQPDEVAHADGRAARFLATDVRDPEACSALMAFARETTGRLDVLINNAGGSPWANAADASPRFVEKIIGLNLLAPLYCAQAANAIMQTQDEGGSIINIGSISGTRPSPGTSAYGAAKAGLHNLTTTLAVEWAPRVRVNAVIGGLLRTEQAHLHYGNEEDIARVASTVPLGRMGTPLDIGAACAFLASSDAAFISGAQLSVHGGGERPAFLDAATDHG